jgi:hypothetical protein
LERLQEDIMQARLERVGAASDAGVGRLAFFAGLPFIAALALSAPHAALAACGPSRPAGVHSGPSGTGVHAATGGPSRGASRGGGTLGCANGAGAPAPHGLSIASSGRVVEGGVHGMAHVSAHPRAAAPKPAKAAAHVRGSKPPHHV